MSFCSFFGGEVFQNHFEPGIYVCAKCGYELFSSRSKYAHSSPWPAFTETIHADSVAKRPEHNRPGAFKAKKLLPPRGSRRAAHTHPGGTLHYGYTLATHRGTGTPDVQTGKGGWLKHQEGSRGLGLHRSSLGKTLVCLYPLPDGPAGPSCGLTLAFCLNWSLKRWPQAELVFE
ncbi:PREDICTED: methionine-R-sulfoxide reductase B1 isoform X1 [Ceratotherium simum simum]|uniref:Methionine-R-sulfoxide reductase B1 n=1 Tax=Ceratotherium simum simum TaxID=73337 RepID=A0ABM1DB79_CERSS|nr:PREDICTED: methionine-R-sulfoxide reductase B1 isoform X1 [Ceratotherium simum simum]